MPGGHAESYLVSNLDGLGGHGLGGLSGGLSGGLGGGLGHGGILLSGHGHQEEVYADHHPKYAYKYGVEDHHTGDHKDAKEERDGDVVHGEYSVLQPDGRKRTVHYTASHHGGFNAHVTYSGHAIHPEVYQHGHGHGW